MDGNYGVGAKIAAATRNPHGVIFLSWKGNEGAMIQLFRSKTGQYGLMQWELLDKSYRHFKPVEDDVKPELIKANGTKVVLLGNSKEDNTMLAPVEAQSPSRWISKFLNTRYFKFPDGIIVKAREGWDYDPNDSHNNYLRHITGQGPYLKHHASYSGTLKLSNAVAHWWILKEDKALTSSGGHLESVGHVAALYQNELKILREITSYGNLWRLTKFNLGIISTCSV